LRIWDTKGNLISAGSSEDYLWGISWNKKGNRIVTSSIEQRIVLWNNKAQRLFALE
jgi:WD40 repeat protein